MQRPIRHAPPRVPAGCISLRAGLLLAVGPWETVAPSGPDFSLPRAQRGGVAERRAAGGGLAPRPRPDRRVSRPAAGVLLAGHTASRPAWGEGGGRWRKGQPSGGRRWWGGHGKSGFIFPILVYPHMLRHTMATTLLANGCPIGHIQTLLGHEHLTTTCKYYLGVMSDAEAKGAHARYLSYNPDGGEKTDEKKTGRESTQPWTLDI